MKRRLQRLISYPRRSAKRRPSGPRIEWRPGDPAPVVFRVAGVAIWIRSLDQGQNLLAKFEAHPRGGEATWVHPSETGMFQSDFARLPMKLKTKTNRAKVIKKLQDVLACFT